MNATISITVTVTDLDALYQAARTDYLLQNEGRPTADVRAEIEDFLGNVEAPVIHACLRQLYDRPLRSTHGIEIQDSAVEVHLSTLATNPSLIDADEPTETR